VVDAQVAGDDVDPGAEATLAGRTPVGPMGSGVEQLAEHFQVAALDGTHQIVVLVGLSGRNSHVMLPGQSVGPLGGR